MNNTALPCPALFPCPLSLSIRYQLVLLSKCCSVFNPPLPVLLIPPAAFRYPSVIHPPFPMPVVHVPLTPFTHLPSTNRFNHSSVDAYARYHPSTHVHVIH